MTETNFLGVSAVIAITAISLTACESESCCSQEIETARASEVKQDLARKAGDDLTTALSSTDVPLPTDADLVAEFRAYRHDYVAVVEYVRSNTDLTRFNLSIKPPQYYTFSGIVGPISKLDVSLMQVLSRGTLPKIIDGDLRSDAQNQELRFLNGRSGTVVAGASKGISFAPNGVQGAVVDKLDELKVVRESVRNIEFKCAYRRIDGTWYVFVCV